MKRGTSLSAMRLGLLLSAAAVLLLAGNPAYGQAEPGVVAAPPSEATPVPEAAPAPPLAPAPEPAPAPPAAEKQSVKKKKKAKDEGQEPGQATVLADDIGSEVFEEFNLDILKIKDLSSMLSDLEKSLEEMKLETVEKYNAKRKAFLEEMEKRKAEADTREREEKEKAEAEERARQDKEKAEAEKRERQDKEKAEAEKREREEKEKVEAEKKEREEKEKAEAEKREREDKEKVEAEKREREEKEKAEAEERARQEKEKAEAEKRERQEKEKAEVEKKEREEKEKAEAEKRKREEKEKEEAEDRAREEKEKAEAEEREREEKEKEEKVTNEKVAEIPAPAEETATVPPPSFEPLPSGDNQPPLPPVAAPAPVPVAAPEYVPVAAPEPVPVAAAEYVPIAAPEYVPVAAPEPVPVSAPEPVSAPAASPEPVPLPEPVPVTPEVPLPVAVAAPAPLPVAAPAPSPVAAPDPLPVAAPDPLPVVALAPPAQGPMNKFVELMFGKVTAVRDAKWALPWQTHAEHIRIKSNEPEERTALDNTPGVFGASVNKFVDLVFGKHSVERDAKWAQPWQTHPEHQGRGSSSEPAVEQPREKVQIQTGGMINGFVNLIFGEAKGPRDPKFAEPWQTHADQQRKYRPSTEEETVKVAVQASGGILHKFVKMIFPGELGVRDPKYAQPWQTHAEHVRAEVPKVTEAVRVEASGGLLDKFVRLVFVVKEEGVRDPKWAQPWQTHEENIRQKAAASPTAPVVRTECMPGFGFLDKFVTMIFGKTSTERDPKWSQPWQTHPEHKRAPPSAEPEVKAAIGASGGILDRFVRLIFHVNLDGVRDPKYATPWQTHEDRVLAQSARPVAATVHSPVDAPAPPPVAAPAPPQVAAPAPPLVAAPAPPPVVAPAPTPVAAPVIPPVAAPATPTVAAPAPPSAAAPAPLPVAAPAPPPVAAPAPLPIAAPAPPPVAAPAQPPVAAPAPVPVVAPPPPPPAAPKSPPPPPQEEAKVVPPSEEPKAKPAEASSAPKEEAKFPSPQTAGTPSKPKPKRSEESTAKKVESKTTESERTIVSSKPEDSEEDESPKDSRSERKAQAESNLVASNDRTDGAHRTKPARKVSKPKSEGAGAEGAKEAAPAASPPVVADTPPPAPAPEKAAPPPPQEDDEEQIILVPTAPRSREHIESILGLDEQARDASKRTDPISDATLKELKNIYGSSIKSLESTFKYQDISNRHMSDAEIFSQPMVLMLGPYSTGKSSFLNYLTGLEYTRKALRTGANPSLGVFRVIQYGTEDQELEGTALSAQPAFQSLQKFGQNFVDQLRGNALNVPLLKKVTFVEAPGILEMRRAGERLYPFNDVLQWFIDRADLVLVMFDYTKLDAGYELEAVLDQLKGREAQVRILLNKADQIPPEDLIKVQGSLFWNLSPLLGVSAPPTVYAGSFTSRPYRPSSPAKLFQAQEEALLHDIARAINARVDNRVAIVRRHAVRVRNHAQMVDTYLTTYNKNKGFLTSKHKLAEDIVENPHLYNIYEGMSLLTNISRYDLPDPEVYRDFFKVHNLYDFPTLKGTCTYLHGCPLDQIDRAISTDLPELLARFRRLLAKAGVTLGLPNSIDQARTTLPPLQHSKAL